MDPVPRKKTEGFAIVSLVVSIIGVISLFFLIIGLMPVYILGIIFELSIAFAAIALLKIKRKPELKGKGLSVNAIIFSGFFLVLITIAALLEPNSSRREIYVDIDHPEPATALNPISMSANMIIQEGQRLPNRISVHNAQDRILRNATITFTCKNVILKPSILTKDIKVNVSVEFDNLLALVNTVPKDQYLCQACLVDSVSGKECIYSKDFVLTVR